jgi:hypothetical protein
MVFCLAASFLASFCRASSTARKPDVSPHGGATAEFEDFMSPIANQDEEAVALRVFLMFVVGVLVVGVATGWLFGLAGIGVLAIIATAAMLLLTVVLTAG